MKIDAATLESIYTGGLQDQPWADVVRDLCERLDALILTLAFRTIREDLPSIGVQAFRGNGREVWDAFFKEYRDIKTFSYEKMTSGTIYPISQFTSENGEDLRRIRAEMHEPLGVGEAYAMVLSDRGSAVAYLIWVKSSAAAITPEEAEWAKLVAPPLARAVGGYHRMRVAELSSRLAADALGRLEVGVVAIDGQGQVLFSNEVAHGLIAHCPDMGIHGGRLIMARPELAAKLEASRTISQAAQVRSLQDTMVGLMMAPVQGGRDELGPGSRPERAIYMHEIARTAPIPETLIAELFGLSRPEARLATLLCAGKTLREAAVEMKIAENSARTYSKIAFSKLGVSRQAELVRHILTSVAIFGNIRKT